MTRRRSLIVGLGLAVALFAQVVIAGTAPVNAADNPYERGPNPTASALERTGPFQYSSKTISNFSTPGFGAATIYYPNTTAEGTFGAVAIAPGFLETQPAIRWYGPHLASHGFVVITISTNSLFDNPYSRGAQILSALDYLVNASPVKDRVDRTRLAVMGHSMGGGGALEAAKAWPALQAAIPLAGYNDDNTWPEIQLPTMVIGAQNDGIAPVSTHSIPFYETMPNTIEKAYLELRGANHFTTNSHTPTVAKYTVSWLKRFVDNDLRYDQFLCPAPSPSSAISQYRNTCPNS